MDLVVDDLTGLTSSGEKDVNLVSGVPSPESAAPLDECGEWLYLGLKEDIVVLLRRNAGLDSLWGFLCFASLEKIP